MAEMDSTPPVILPITLWSLLCWKAHILSNLITNAIKFSHDGSTISLFTEKTGDKIEIDIKDEGIGIPGNLLEGIFSPKNRISRKGTNSERGTGYGLLLVKKYTDFIMSVNIITQQISKFFMVNRFLQNTFKFNLNFLIDFN